MRETMMIGEKFHRDYIANMGHLIVTHYSGSDPFNFLVYNTWTLDHSVYYPTTSHWGTVYTPTAWDGNPSNWIEWPGLPDQPEEGPTCRHEWVNVSFTGLKYVCKHCNVERVD